MIDGDQLAKKSVEKVRRLEDMVPQLMAMATKVDAPVKTRFFEGLEGLKTLYPQIITDGDSNMED